MKWPTEGSKMRHRSTRNLLLWITLIAAPAQAADEIHWTFTGPTSVSFDWRGSETTVRYGLTTSYGSTATAVTPSPLPFSSTGPFREAKLTGLQPGTVYHYSIGTGPDHTFRTPLPPGASDFTVYAQGDVGYDDGWWRMGELQAMIGSARPHFVLMVGDLTYGNSTSQSSVDKHFNDVMVWSQDAAYMPSWGNHEWDDPSRDDLRNYKGRFDLPNPQASPGAPSVGGAGEDWNWFDYGNVRFIAYPEPYTSSTWSDWHTKARALMDQAQADPNIRFIVTHGHRPPWSSGYHESETQIQSILGQLGAGHSKYVLNLNGHSHNYERTYPQNGVIHLTVGTGGADLEVSGSSSCVWPGGCPKPSWSAYRAMHHVAVQLRFTANGIQVTAFCGPAGDSGENDVSCTKGTVLDSFTIGAVPVADLVAPARILDLQ
jgi:hypothetical protein